MSTDIKEQIIEAIAQRKGRRVAVVDLSNAETAVAEDFIICEGGSSTNVAALADNVRQRLWETVGRKPYGYDGYETCEWIVIDYGEAVVHIMMPETRRRYDLEGLWSDAPVVFLPDD